VRKDAPTEAHRDQVWDSSGWIALLAAAQACRPQLKCELAQGPRQASLTVRDVGMSSFTRGSSTSFPAQSRSGQVWRGGGCVGKGVGIPRIVNNVVDNMQASHALPVMLQAMVDWGHDRSADASNSCFESGGNASGRSATIGW